MRKFFLAIFFIAFISNHSTAQDTTVVQTFTFNELSNRRGVFKFPPATEKFRKILMKYTLKCDPRISNPTNSGCGEWDYLTYTYVYNHDGKLDSTPKSGNLFRVVNQYPASVSYNHNPIYDYTRETQYRVRRTGTTNLDSAIIGSGTDNSTDVFKTSELTGKAQFLWKASEISSAGLNAGVFTGMRFNISSLGSEVRNLEIKMGQTTQDSIGESFHTGLQRVYRYNTTFAGNGYQDIQFTNSFNWNGTSNIIVEISFEGDQKGTNTIVASDSVGFDAALSSFGTDYYLTFDQQDFVQLDRAIQTTGNGARTIECWGRATAFNNGGLFQAGPSGTARDFTLRTTGTKDRWKSNTWGGTDFTMNVPNSHNEWHHYAMVHTGSKVIVYVDGVEVNSKNATLNTPAYNPVIGRWQGSYFRGDIDEVRFWNTALSASTIKEWMGKTIDNNHPQLADLKAYYPFDEATGHIVSDRSPNNAPDGKTLGFPEWNRHLNTGLMKNLKVSRNRPAVIFEQGIYSSSVTDSLISLDSIKRDPFAVVFYTNPANGVIVQENDPMHPSLPTDTVYAWENNGFQWVMDPVTRVVIDSIPIPVDTTVFQQRKEWFSPETRLEIARYITPYGNNLDLGDGFTWWYDVTDYAQYLVDSVDLQAHNWQELIDLKFIMIKGTPEREVLRVTKVWGNQRSIRYRNMSDDSDLSSTTIKLDPRAKEFRVRGRLTGHGHNSDDGNYPHCCEWKDNEHTLHVNGKTYHKWHIWQTHDCALNPVYPQGGTWPGAREGWCPGDVVKDEVIEITPEVTGDSVTLDYSITPVPTNNPGMGNGNYQTAFHLIQYAPSKHKLDLELVDVITPNREGKYDRAGVICENPRAIVRNVGTSTVNQFKLNWMEKGEVAQSLSYGVTLAPQEEVELDMPVTREWFYTGDGSQTFMAKVCQPNNMTDENTQNDQVSVFWDKPDHYTGNLVVEFRTNNRPQDNKYSVVNMKGDTILKKDGLTRAGFFHRDTLKLSEGCYVFDVLDRNNDGLQYWANSSQGSGLVRFMVYDNSWNLIRPKAFGSDFGRSIKYSFTYGTQLGDYPSEKIDTLEDQTCFNPNYEWLSEEEISRKVNERSDYFNVYPNPASGTINLELTMYNGELDVEILNSQGQSLKELTLQSKDYSVHPIDISSFDRGVYFIRVRGEQVTATRQFIVK